MKMAMSNRRCRLFRASINTTAGRSAKGVVLSDVVRVSAPAIMALVTMLCVTTGALRAEGAVTLDVQLPRGGLDLDFGTLTPGQQAHTQELEMTLTNTGTGRYRVYQELPGLLVNERGDRLADGALVMQLSEGFHGTRGVDGIVPVSEQAQELYVSDAAGTSDTARVAYSLMPATPLAAGSYHGVLRLTVESSDTGAVTTKNLTMSVTVSSVCRLERQSGAPSQLQFGETKPGEQSKAQELAFQLANNASAMVRVVQELAEPLVNQQGVTFPQDALLYSVVSAQGSAPPRPTASSQDTILTDDQGALREFRLIYAIAVPPTQIAGTYRGTLRLRLICSGTGGTDVVTVPIEVTVAELFTVSVLSADGGGSDLRFNHPSAVEETIERTLTIEIHTNVGKPYQLLGGLNHALVLPSGDTLPTTALVWTVSNAGKGTSVLAPNSPVPLAYQPVYQSDATGSPDTFLLTCRLTIPRDAKEGTYFGQLRFSITMS